MIAAATPVPLATFIENIINAEKPKPSRELDKQVAASYPGMLERHSIDYAVADLVSSGKITWDDQACGWKPRRR